MAVRLVTEWVVLINPDESQHNYTWATIKFNRGGSQRRQERRRGSRDAAYERYVFFDRVESRVRARTQRAVEVAMMQSGREWVRDSLRKRVDLALPPPYDLVHLWNAL